MKLAIAQLNPTVGDIAGNTRATIDAIQRAREAAVDVVLFPEMGILGYPPRDLVLREDVVLRCERAVERIAGETRGIAAIISHPRNATGGTKHLHNSSSVIIDGRVEHVYDKQLLPGYDVFDEDRWFEPGRGEVVFEIAGRRCGVLICEDIWRARDARGGERVIPSVDDDPVTRIVQQGCQILLVPSASPFVAGKGARHLVQLRALAREHSITIALANQVGANDDLIFDGRSVVIMPDGEVVARARAFAEDFISIDLDDAKALNDAPDLNGGEVFDALVLGVRDYVRKTGHSQVVLGLSGGIDSAVTAAIASVALNSKNVTGIMMPSQYSSTGSIDDAITLASNLGMRPPHTVSIEWAHDALAQTLNEPIGDLPGSVTDQNVQARLRGIILMAVSNSRGSLVLATGNKSELAMGYCTLYGDMAGALSPLGDVLKTEVYDLARWVNEHHARYGFALPPIPESSIAKAPSAELRPDQTDQDTLPPYSILDEIVRRYVDHEQSAARIIGETGFAAELVNAAVLQIDRSEYKRLQSAIILKIAQRTFGPGRPMPVAMRET